MEPFARVVEDSISPDGIRLVTVEATFHRFVLAELNTHRMFSRNAASSRAIPVKKQLERVREDPMLPVFWGKNQAGMQAAEELEDSKREMAIKYWLTARDEMTSMVELLGLDLGLHKQLSNRLIEPWMSCTDIITSVEWSNFFHQRYHWAAQPEFKALAKSIYRAISRSTPTKLSYNQVHLPYITDEERAHHAVDHLKCVSAARCARVSYLNHDGTNPDFEKDMELFVKLRDSDPMHPSPLEHVGSPCTHMHRINELNDLLQDEPAIRIGCKQWGNLPGYHQFRKEFGRENVTVFELNQPSLMED